MEETCGLFFTGESAFKKALDEGGPRPPVQGGVG